MYRPAKMAGVTPDQARDIPACQVCGCQNDTLRLVVYPFGISLFLVTFRRSYSGLLCQRHRSLRWLMASAISAWKGWLGIPFGIFLAPAALFQLAQGGDQPRAANARLLKSLGEHKLQDGDLVGAARCLESSLEYQDSPKVRAQLRKIYRTETLRQSISPAPDRVEQAAQIVSFMVLAAVFGVGVGLINFYLFHLAIPDSAAQVQIWKAILIWPPLVSLGVLAVMLIRTRLDRLYQRVRIQREVLASGLGLLAGGLLAYGFPTGWAVGRFADRLFSGSVQLPTDQILPIVGSTLTRGGFIEIGNLLASHSIFGFVCLILLAFLLVYALFALETGTRQAAARHRLLAEVRVNNGYPSSDLPGWAALGIVPLAFFFLISAIH